METGNNNTITFNAIDIHNDYLYNIFDIYVVTSYN